MSQNSDILAYLESGKSLTPLEALELFGTLRLGARVYDLKRAGHDIQSRMVRVPTRNGSADVAEYRMGK